MSTYGYHQQTARSGKPLSLWIVETLVVLGVIAFGYAAVTMDGPLFGSQPAPAVAASSVDPLAELLR